MKRFLIAFGAILAMWPAILMLITFFTAMANGGQIMVDINHYGEMRIEMIIFPLGVVIITYSTVWTLIDWMRVKRFKKESNKSSSSN